MTWRPRFWSSDNIQFHDKLDGTGSGARKYKANMSMSPERRLSSLHLLSSAEISLNIGWINVSSADDEWRLSQGMLRLLDFPETDINLRWLVMKSIHSDDRSRFKESLALMLRGIMPPTQTFKIVRRTGGIAQIQFHYQELTDSAGRAVYVLFGRDVTAEHAMSLASDDAAHRLDVFMEALDVDCLWRGNLKGVSFESVGRGMLKYEGVDPGLTWVEHVPKGDQGGLQKSVDKLIEADSRFSIRVNIMCVDNVVRPYNLSGIPVKGPSGKTVEWCGTIKRISGTERSRREEMMAAILPMITGAEVRAACGLLGWSHLDAAQQSGLSKTTISRFASTGGPLCGIFKAGSVAAFLSAMLDAGIFLNLSDAGELSLALDREAKRA